MWQAFNVVEVARKLRTNIERVLSKEEAENRRNKHGPNKLEEKKKENILIRFIKEFKDFMIIILIIAAIVSAVVSYIQGMVEF